MSVVLRRDERPVRPLGAAVCRRNTAPARKYTVEEWLEWDEDYRCELIDGELYEMAPPTLKHQDIVGEIYLQLRLHLKGKPYRVFLAPAGVRLKADEQSAFEPDVFVVSDEAKLAGGRICEGAPDMVVEILSPSTSGKDRVLKFNKYLQAGVREYWIVDPSDNTVTVNVLENGYYRSNAYGETDVVPVSIIEGCTVDLNTVFL